MKTAPKSRYGQLPRDELCTYTTLFKKYSIYLFMSDRETEAETQAEGEAGSMQGA